MAIVEEMQMADNNNKGRMYASCVRSSMIYGSETGPLLADVRLKFKRVGSESESIINGTLNAKINRLFRCQ